MHRLFAWQRWLAVICLGATAAVVSMQHSGRIPADLVTEKRASNLWFEGDLPDVYRAMSDHADPKHHRSNRHLLFPLASHPPAMLFRTLFGLEPWPAVRATMAALSVVWVALLFRLLILLGCGVFDGILFCLLAISSAAALFWFSVPETWAFGSTTLIAALAITAWRQHRGDSERWLSLGSALTLSMTTSNWMMGWAMAFTALPWRRALRVTAVAMALVLALGTAQKVVYPKARLFAHLSYFKRFAIQESAGGPVSVARAFFLHVMVMPEIGEFDLGKQRGSRLTVQHGAFGSGGRWGALASFAWMGLLAAGVWGLAGQWRRQRGFLLVLVLSLSGQLLLHLVYGAEETFLFGLHWLPLLVVVAAFGSLTKARHAVRILAALCILFSAINNERQFGRAVGQLHEWVPAAVLASLAIGRPP